MTDFIKKWQPLTEGFDSFKTKNILSYLLERTNNNLNNLSYHTAYEIQSIKSKIIPLIARLLGPIISNNLNLFVDGIDSKVVTHNNSHCYHIDLDEMEYLVITIDDHTQEYVILDKINKCINDNITLTDEETLQLTYDDENVAEVTKIITSACYELLTPTDYFNDLTMRASSDVIQLLSKSYCFCNQIIDCNIKFYFNGIEIIKDDTLDNKLIIIRNDVIRFIPQNVAYDKHNNKLYLGISKIEFNKNNSVYRFIK